ncbi:MAG: flagellar motor switch protein FliM [Opitutales bacterium]
MIDDEENPMLPQDGGSEYNELLEQGDIDALMEEASAEQKEAIYNCHGELFSSHDRVNVEVYDFRNPVFLTEVELRQVRIRHENFVHYLSARLAMFLRMEFSMKMSKLGTAPYARFIESIPNPTHIALFKIDPLSGVGVVDINPRLALTIVNRMLGGQGHSIHEERYLTEIEQALMDDVMAIVLDEWCRQWEEADDLNGSILGRENNGRFLQTSPSDSIMLVLDVEAAIGDCSEMMQIAVPFYMIEPIVKRMQAANRTFGRGAEMDRHAKWLPVYRGINVPVYAEWDAFEVTVQDLLSLRPGDVLELPETINQQTRLRFHNTTRYLGEAGVENGHMAVKVTEKLEDEEEA